MGGTNTKTSGKRTRSDSEEEQDQCTRVIDVPKRKKLKTTSCYIFQTLFLNGEGSDVTIDALGQEWKLHKLYLCQSRYFQSMFGGPWRESTEEIIHIEIPDERIDLEALRAAFGSLYSDEVIISPGRVTPLLAAACMLQLDGLLQQCAETMVETINSETVCQYHAAAREYGQTAVERKCVEWLERRLSSSLSVSLLREISPSLMEQVVKSPDLFVMQIEVDIYNLLKMWTFLKLNTAWSGNRKELSTQSTEYFRAREGDGAFLETTKGLEFAAAFRGIRLYHVINDVRSVQLLDNDKIIPQGWLKPIYKVQWTKTLSVFQGLDPGPTSDTTPEQFSSVAFRCGRVLDDSVLYYWRWTGFSYGIDIIVTYNNRNRTLLFRRNSYSQPTTAALCLQARRSLMAKVSVASFDSNGCEKYFKTSDLLYLNLGHDEEVQVLQVDKKVAYPLHVSAHLAFVSPNSEIALTEQSD